MNNKTINLTGFDTKAGSAISNRIQNLFAPLALEMGVERTVFSQFVAYAYLATGNWDQVVQRLSYLAIDYGIQVHGADGLHRVA